MSQTPEPSCEFCNKKGLAVLPVRYAIAAPQSSAPPLSGPFKVDVAPTLGKAHYTTRLLRSGYLYVYDEARKRWEEYFVTSDSHYFKLPARGPNVVKPALPQAFACARNGHAPLASCITIRDAKHATTVWFGFSDVEWTDAVLKKHESADYRARHMQKLVISGGKATPGAPHTQPMTQVDKRVTEYGLEARVGIKDFAWSPFTYTPRPAQAAALIAAAERLAPGAGIVLALPDPAGITQELAQLMQFEVQHFLTKEEYARPLAVSHAIQQLKAAIEDQAVRQEYSAAEQLKAQQLSAESGAFVVDALRDLINDKDRPEARASRIENTFRVTDADKVKAKRRAWVGKYDIKYNEAERKRFQDEFDVKFTNFDAEVILPLTLAHCSWLKSEVLANYFECNFCSQDIAAGFAYQTVFARCIADVADKAACVMQIEMWVQGEVSDHKNLLLRALAANNDVLVAKIEGAAKPGVLPDALPWDNVFDVYKEMVMASRHLSGDFATRVARSSGFAEVALHAGGALIKSLSKVDGFALTWSTRLLMLLGVGAGRPIGSIKIKGERKEFRALIQASIMQAHAGNDAINWDRIKGSINREVARMEGKALVGNTQAEWYILIDEKRLVEARLDDVKKAVLDKRLSRIWITPEQAERLTRNNVRKFLDIEGRLGVVSLILQLVSLNKAIKDDVGSMQHEAKENRLKMHMAAATAAGTSTELVAEAMRRKGWGVSPLMKGTTWKPLRFSGQRLLSFVGKMVGAVAGVVVAVIDFLHGIDEFKNRNRGLAVLYMASAGLGFVLAFALGFGWFGGPLGLLIAAILVGLFLLVTVLIELFKDNKVQDWLERCFFGVSFKAEGFSDIDKEMHELDLALR